MLSCFFTKTFVYISENFNFFKLFDFENVGDGMKSFGSEIVENTFGAQEPASPRHGAGVGKGAEPPFFLADCNAECLKTAKQETL